MINILLSKVHKKVYLEQF